jgi:hypothetical protein
MHGLEGADKGIAYKKLKAKVLDVRVAQAIDSLKDVEGRKGKDVLERQAFKSLAEVDRKLLYKEYGFSDSENDEK